MYSSRSKLLKKKYNIKYIFILLNELNIHIYYNTLYVFISELVESRIMNNLTEITAILITF